MKKKLIITESQLNSLKKTLNENAEHPMMVKRIKEELDANYTSVEKFVKEGGEYSSQPMFEIKVDEEVISPERLLEYFNNKYDVSKPFLEQVIRDWVDGKITEDYQLSKNISMR